MVVRVGNSRLSYGTYRSAGSRADQYVEQSRS